MARLLIHVPESQDGIHGARAWRMASALCEETDAFVVYDTSFEPWTVWAGLITNSHGDVAVLSRLRSLGRPAVYYPSLGPVQDGLFVSKDLHEADHLVSIRRKMQLASAVLVDSFAQARAAQDHYGVTCPWIIISGCRTAHAKWSPAAVSRTVLVVGGSASQKGTVTDWIGQNATDYEATMVDGADEATSLIQAGSAEWFVVWLTDTWHPNPFLDVCACVGPVVASRRTCLDMSPLLAEWVDVDHTSSIVAGLQRALRWDAARYRVKRNLLASRDWHRWCTELLCALRPLASSPVSDYLVTGPP